MRHVLLPLALAAAAMLVPPAAEANTILRQLARTGLTQEDLTIMMRQGGTLYTDRRATPGSDTIWSNPATGAHGLVEVITVSGDCVTLAYKFRTTRRPAIQTVETRRCLTDSGWVLTP